MPTVCTRRSWRRSHWRVRPRSSHHGFAEAPGPTGKATHNGTASRAVPARKGPEAASVPRMLQFQRDRDAAGGGVVLRSVADAALNDAAATPGLRRADAKAHVLRSIDRLLSDEARTAALESAADAATAGGRCSALVLGAGSLLPALLLARRGAAVCVVEASPLLADVVRAAAVENGVRLAVLSSLASASAAYRQPGVSPPTLLVSEAVDDGLLADGVLPSLRAARALLASSRGGGGDAVAVLPRAASVEASLLQLGFSGVPGFGLDGVDIDLRHFDALRPRGVRARLPPGYWPVRLSEWKQPHRRLSDSLPVCRVVEDGLLNAVCYWFTLDLGGGGQVSSAPPKRRDRPGSWRAGWRQAAVYLEEPLHVVRGESVRLAWRVSDEGIRFSAAGVRSQFYHVRIKNATRFSLQEANEFQEFSFFTPDVGSDAYANFGDTKMSITVGSSGVDYSDPTKPVFKGAVGFGGRGLSIWKASDVSAWGKHGVLFFRAAPSGTALGPECCQTGRHARVCVLMAASLREPP
ncbi:hypothetical protein EMIHUDRAFT_247673 [Emiliania huxleyi CCMP1516]|uniref:PRMT5 oligomerisation domain-containing protein n=2 Tax=Emiliania huxleyi TaxID=2903 RepID=A0A0D3IL31_EMIH1|nr:hypothetical protein EMIHUDRAFT_247673 [Emiliania huxleyi CCMP1516]EOD11966.1 hypothetical protein EMIHUDRAFT_247673 [Emiliania huxleyi CCMP1516]|eukprot:XP_005764395.1 hypothetical protein EMIHUDRAFT_247673 [Emiliania huxleyi CCMP1516]